MHHADVFVGSGLARTDGPHGFVSHGEAGIVRIGAEPGKPSFELEPEDAVEFPGLAFGEGFTDTKDDGKALFQRERRLLAYEVRALPKHMAAFGMAREHPCATGFAEHGRGNLAGESPGFGGVHILRADEDAGGPVETFPRGLQSGERRKHDDIPIVRRAAKDRGEFVRGGFGFRAGFVHLPVGGDNGAHRILPRA